MMYVTFPKMDNGALPDFSLYSIIFMLYFYLRWQADVPWISEIVAVNPRGAMFFNMCFLSAFPLCF